VKICSKCKENKSFAEFSLARSKPDGLCSDCKICRKARNAEYYRANREKICVRTNAHHQLNKEARNAVSREKYKANPEPKRLKNLTWNKANPEVLRQWEMDNPEKVSAKGKAWYARNRERHLANGRRRRAENPELNAMYRAKRRAAKIQRTPLWLTEQDRKSIAYMYCWARAMQVLTGVAHHVDHIYPLQGEFVSGLHVPGNLQVLTAYENISKKNTYVPE